MPYLDHDPVARGRSRCACVRVHRHAEGFVTLIARGECVCAGTGYTPDITAVARGGRGLVLDAAGRRVLHVVTLAAQSTRNEGTPCNS